MTSCINMTKSVDAESASKEIFLMNQKNRNTRQGQNIGQNVPVIIDGTPATVNTGDVPANSWIHCHGKTQGGAEVNSLKITQVGQSALIQDATGFTASFDADELEVAAAKLLRQKGYTVGTKQGN